MQKIFHILHSQIRIFYVHRLENILYFTYTGLPFDESLVKSDKSVQDEEIVKLLKTSANPKVKKLIDKMKDIPMKYFLGCQEEEEGSREGDH